MTEPVAPPCETLPGSVIETIGVPDLVDAWRRDFGIDVERLFAGIAALDLIEDTATGRMDFRPAITGDAAFYAALRKFRWYHPATKAEYAAAARWLGDTGRVVDVGAGLGGFAAYVPRRQYLGLETDPDAVAACTARGLTVLGLDPGRARQVVPPAELVTAFQVLEHVAHPEAFLADLAGLTAPGGRIAIGVPDAGSYVAGLPDFVLNAPPHHVSWWTETALRALFEGAGLKVLAAERFPVEPWERQIWWMAKLAGRDGRRRFGRQLRTRKVLAYIGSLGLQVLPVPKAARGATLFMVGERA